VRAEYLHRMNEVRVDDPRGLTAAAVLEFVRGNKESAERMLRHGVRLTWPVPTFRADLVQLLIWSGRLDEAEEETKQLEAHNATGLAARLSRGNLLLARGRKAEARGHFAALVADGFTDAAVLRGQRAARAE